MEHGEGRYEAQQEKPDGERWLELIGYGHLKGQPTGFVIDGQPVPAEQFDKLCGDHARPIFAALEKLDRNDPRYEQFIGVARKAFHAKLLKGILGPLKPNSNKGVGWKQNFRT